MTHGLYTWAGTVRDVELFQFMRAGVVISLAVLFYPVVLHGARQLLGLYQEVYGDAHKGA
jgi:hypothetical protein